MLKSPSVNFQDIFSQLVTATQRVSTQVCGEWLRSYGLILLVFKTKRANTPANRISPSANSRALTPGEGKRVVA